MCRLNQLTSLRDMDKKKQSSLCKRFTKTGTFFLPTLQNIVFWCCTVRTSSAEGCLLTSTFFIGHCSKGPACLYRHDPMTVAICSTYLQKGACPAGASCDLSHEPTPERVPACVHFLRGKCSNLPCRYAHVRVDPSASVCKNYATLGYCGDGANCSNRHVHECPDYANTGTCRKKRCDLPHVDRAGQIRRHAAQSTDRRDGPQVIEANPNDISSDEDTDVDTDGEDVDSDDIADDLIEGVDALGRQALAEQHDFVGF